MELNSLNNFERAWCQKHPHQVLSNLAQWFRRSFIKTFSLEKVYRQTYDGHHNITIAHESKSKAPTTLKLGWWGGGGYKQTTKQYSQKLIVLIWSRNLSYKKNTVDKTPGKSGSCSLLASLEFFHAQSWFLTFIKLNFCSKFVISSSQVFCIFSTKSKITFLLKRFCNFSRGNLQCL